VPIWILGIIAILLAHPAWAKLTGTRQEILSTLQELKRSPDPKFLRDLAEGLVLEDSAVGQAAREGILALPDWKTHARKFAASTDKVDRYLSASVLVLDVRDPELARAFAGLLEDPHAKIRSRAASLAIAWKDGAGADVLRKSLTARVERETDSSLRYSLVFALARLASDNECPLLIRASKDAVPMVREAAIHGLGNLAEARGPSKEQAIERLMVIAKTGDDRERIVAFYYVGKHGGPGGSKLLRRVASDHPSEQVRKAAQESVR